VAARDWAALQRRKRLKGSRRKRDVTATTNSSTPYATSGRFTFNE